MAPRLTHVTHEVTPGTSAMNLFMPNLNVPSAGDHGEEGATRKRKWLGASADST